MRRFLPHGCGLLGMLAVGLLIVLGTGVAGAATPPVTPTMVAPTADTSSGGPGRPDARAQAPGPAGGGTPVGRPVGLPAIQPRTTNPAPGQAAFAVQDVIDYVLARGVQGARIGSSGPITVDKVEFLSGRDANARLHQETGQAEETLLCVVTVRGAFILQAPMPGHDRTFTAAVLVFDARTGNLLQQGEAPSTP